MDHVPRITVLGSCRVHTPCSILEKQGRILLNQKKIFGFVHNTREIIQQAQIMAGEISVPSRLRPYVNIPDNWAPPKASSPQSFGDIFRDTDIFVVEISSVRLIQFKALFLQINRTRELIADQNPDLRTWWDDLIRYGRNSFRAAPQREPANVAEEVAFGLSAIEQDANALLDDINKISAMLAKPVLYVSHFNLDYDCKPIPQRQLIADTLESASREFGVKYIDPTPLVIANGFKESIMDLGHYKEEFEPKVADLIGTRIDNMVRINS